MIRCIKCRFWEQRDYEDYAIRSSDRTGPAPSGLCMRYAPRPEFGRNLIHVLDRPVTGASDGCGDGKKIRKVKR